MLLVDSSQSGLPCWAVSCLNATAVMSMYYIVLSCRPASVMAFDEASCDSKKFNPGYMALKVVLELWGYVLVRCNNFHEKWCGVASNRCTFLLSSVACDIQMAAFSKITKLK